MRIRAIVATAKGGPEVFSEQPVELEWPRGPGDVLVRLSAASVNPADCFFRQLGGYIENPGPLVLGHDGAGIVEAVGSEAKRVSPGMRVAFCNGGIGGAPGTYADYAVVPEDQLAAIPDTVSFEQAAALPLVAITAWESLNWRARLAAGERALIHGGAGGTGHMAIQLAKLAGAQVATTVSSPEKARFAATLGAELCINYRQEDFVAQALEWSGGKGVDVALDNAGADILRRTYACMVPYGRIVTLMGLADDDEQLTAYNNNLSVIAEMMLLPMWRGLAERLAAQAGIVETCLSLLSSGKLSVHISHSLPLDQVAEAHRLLEAGGMTGKIVLQIRA
ncbi:MAG: zinc-binding dehydrogenase [Rhizobiales bacterium]|nr:zinc-binding dehydrogenase [Hyphomicrobiales bacterium]